MRSNGLQAAAYSPVADLNPSVAEALLDELKERHIAAYCQPIDTPSMSAFDRPEFHVEILVRMYVDASATDQVLELLSTKDPHFVQGNDDLTWAQIVAGYDTPTTTAVAPWPVYEDVDAATDESEAPNALLPQPEPLGSDAPDPSIGRRRTRFEEPAEEDRFVPPQPPPLPRLGAADQLGWLGLIGGPAVLVAGAVFSLALPSWVTLFAALAFIGGFVSLVIRMDNGEDRYDDPDNGAQV
jgi:hypothetical protein